MLAVFEAALEWSEGAPAAFEPAPALLEAVLAIRAAPLAVFEAALEWSEGAPAAFEPAPAWFEAAMASFFEVVLAVFETALEWPEGAPAAFELAPAWFEAALALGPALGWSAAALATAPFVLCSSPGFPSPPPLREGCAGIRGPSWCGTLSTTRDCFRLVTRRLLARSTASEHVLAAYPRRGALAWHFPPCPTACSPARVTLWPFL
jgi:hypothetical protein